MKKKLLTSYINGNYTVALFNDGTKIRETVDDEFVPVYPECCDVHISDCCDNGCPMCYADCNPNGKFADLDQPWVETLMPGMELALNLNYPFHPGLIPFLKKLKDKGVIVNVTINQKHFMEHLDFIDMLAGEKLVYGIGVSLTDPTKRFIHEIKRYPNAVIHTIAGILSKEQLDELSGNNLKILILGYKIKGRGSEYLSRHTEIADKIKWLSTNIKSYVNKFQVVSFDNLALEQLNVKDILSTKEWDEFYQGDDGDFTFFINMVDKTFCKSSLVLKESTEIYPVLSNVKDMFTIIRNRRNR